jgi:hypothetical protein
MPPLLLLTSLPLSSQMSPVVVSALLVVIGILVVIVFFQKLSKVLRPQEEWGESEPMQFVRAFHALWLAGSRFF